MKEKLILQKKKKKKTKTKTHRTIPCMRRPPIEQTGLPECTQSSRTMPPTTKCHTMVDLDRLYCAAWQGFRVVPSFSTNETKILNDLMMNCWNYLHLFASNRARWGKPKRRTTIPKSLRRKKLQVEKIKKTHTTTTTTTITHHLQKSLHNKLWKTSHTHSSGRGDKHAYPQQYSDWIRWRGWRERGVCNLWAIVVTSFSSESPDSSFILAIRWNNCGH